VPFVSSNTVRGARRERRYAPMLIHADDLVVL